jgi:hypothetical protein
MPQSQKKEKRDIPDPVEWLKSRQGGANGPENAGAQMPNQGHSKTMTPGQSGRDNSASDPSGATNGFGNNTKREPAPKKGQQVPAHQARGKGGKKTELSPSNKKHAGSMTKGKPAFGLPSRDSMVRRLHPNFAGNKNPPSRSSQPNRSGILSKFEGFTPNKG